MRHDIHKKGEAFSLRPVDLSDAQFIIDLRNDTERNKFVHPISNNVVDQEAYIREYFDRPGDYYFIVERNYDRKPQGTIAVCNVDNVENDGEFGRWVLLKDSVAAIESSLLLYRIAFEILELKMVYTRTIANNDKVVSFHGSCGLETSDVFKAHFNIRGVLYDAIEQRITEDKWAEVEKLMSEKAKTISRMIKRWSQQG